MHFWRLLQSRRVDLLDLGTFYGILRFKHGRNLLRLDLVNLLVYVLLNRHVCDFYLPEQVLNVKRLHVS